MFNVWVKINRKSWRWRALVLMPNPLYSYSRATIMESAVCRSVEPAPQYRKSGLVFYLNSSPSDPMSFTQQALQSLDGADGWGHSICLWHPEIYPTYSNNKLAALSSLACSGHASSFTSNRVIISSLSHEHPFSGIRTISLLKFLIHRTN